jgi:hypothetical protein
MQNAEEDTPTHARRDTFLTPFPNKFLAELHHQIPYCLKKGMNGLQKKNFRSDMLTSERSMHASERRERGRGRGE